VDASELRTPPIDAEVGTGPVPGKAMPGGNLLQPRQIWAIALAAGVAAGLISWLVGEWTLEAFKPRLFKQQIMLQTVIQPTNASQNAADLKNAILAHAILGSVMGLTLGVAGGLAGRSPSRGMVAGLGGLAAGALVGGVAASALLPLFYRRNVPDLNDLMTPILLHGGIWMAIGAVGGAAFAIGLGAVRWLPNAIVGACIGALLATIGFHLLGASLFPEAGSIDAMPSSALVRLIARLLVTLLIAAGAAWGVQGRLNVPYPPATPV
jgi:hypothetical protein